MKENALVGLVTIGLLIVLIGLVASGIEDIGPITMARHFPVTTDDYAKAESLGKLYRLCETDFAYRLHAKYPSADVLADTSAQVCTAQLHAIQAFLVGKGYPAAVVDREVQGIREAEERGNRVLIARLYE